MGRGVATPAWEAGLGSFALAASLLVAVPPVQAYSTPDAYGERPSAGGGGGRWFTGSPAEGYGCSVCHSSVEGDPHYPLYVAGLPLSGYELATTQEVVLSWPEFRARWQSARPDPLNLPPPTDPTPALGMVAEFVAESGKGSGVVEIDADNAGPDELCEMTRPNLKPRLGVNLYQVRAGAEPLRIRPDSTGTLRCESRQLAQRCLVALNSCGAHTVRIRWTTPGSWQGPIWFSAGFVATDVLSGSFDRDSVDEITVPILPADGGSTKYERILRGGCGLAPSQGRPGVSSWALMLALAAWLRTRRRRGRSPCV